MEAHTCLRPPFGTCPSLRGQSACNPPSASFLLPARPCSRGFPEAPPAGPTPLDRARTSKRVISGPNQVESRSEVQIRSKAGQSRPKSALCRGVRWGRCRRGRSGWGGGGGGACSSLESLYPTEALRKILSCCRGASLTNWSLSFGNSQSPNSGNSATFRAELKVTHLR